MLKESKIESVYKIYKSWLEPFLRHPIRTSMIVGGLNLALRLSEVNAGDGDNKSKQEKYIISNDPNISAHADGATLTTNAHLLFKDEEGPTKLDRLLEVSVDSVGLEYKIQKDPEGYLKRVIGNKENQESIKRLAKYFLDSKRFVKDSGSISDLQSALDDNVIYGEEIRDVKPGLYAGNVLTEPYNRDNGASIIFYLDVQDGKNPNTNASRQTPTLSSNEQKLSENSKDISKESKDDHKPRDHKPRDHKYGDHECNKCDFPYMKIGAGRLFDTNIYNGFFLETAFHVGNGFFIGPGVGYRVGNDTQHAYGEGETHFGRTSFWEETSSDKFSNWDLYATSSKSFDLGKDFSISPTLKIGYSNKTFSENNRYTSGRVDSLGNQSDVFTNSDGKSEKEGQMLFGIGSGFDYKRVGINAGVIVSEDTNYYVGANINFGNFGGK